MEKPKIDPWGSVEIGDYAKVFKEFGVEAIAENHRAVLQNHVFRRNLAIGHRGLDKIVNSIINKKPFYCLTGIACSGPLHFGHKLVLETAVMFRELGGQLKVAIADLDGYLSRERIKTLDQARDFAVENLAHALALGVKKDEVYLQSRMSNRYFSFSYEISKKITPAEFEAIYGTLDFGKISAVLLQIADILHPQLDEYGKRMPGIVPIGLDQDPHIRLTRDLCERLPYGLTPPSSVYLAHQPGLREGAKMSSSEPFAAILLSDTPEAAEDKIMRALTGGRKTAEEQRRMGANPDICKVCGFLKFQNPDDKIVDRQLGACRTGKQLCGENKQFTAEFVMKWLEDHQKKFKKYEPVARKIIEG